jgi:hypothetical protein
MQLLNIETVDAAEFESVVAKLRELIGSAKSG